MLLIHPFLTVRVEAKLVTHINIPPTAQTGEAHSGHVQNGQRRPQKSTRCLHSAPAVTSMSLKDLAVQSVLKRRPLQPKTFIMFCSRTVESSHRTEEQYNTSVYCFKFPSSDIILRTKILIIYYKQCIPTVH